MSYILALDQGTTSSRTIVFDRQGRALAVSQREFEQVFPRSGWVEHDAEEIWVTQLATAREAIEKAGVGAGNISGVGITNQRETTVIWDRQTGEPIHHAIVWQDRRTASICDALRADGHEQLFAGKTGLVIDAYFSGTKVKWLLDNVPGARKRAGAGELAFGTIDTWLIWKLTGGRLHVTDATNASRTMMYDIHRGDWDDELLKLLDIPRELLPEVRASSEVLGESDEDVLGEPIPIAGVAGDQQAALFGQMCISPGMVKTTYGTGCFMLLNTGTEAVASKNKLLTTVAWKIGDHTEYALEGSVFIGGAVVQWLRDGLKLIKKSSEVEALARMVEDNGGVYMVPAFAGLGAPHWDAYARGAVMGITRGTNAGHFARAALESIAFQVGDLMAAMREDSGMDIAEMRVDGGAAANDLLMQFQADLLGVPVVRPTQLETTALGAAYLAGLATGVWDSREAIAEHWQVDRRFEAAMPDEQVRGLRAHWSAALERAQGWAKIENE